MSAVLIGVSTQDVDNPHPARAGSWRIDAGQTRLLRTSRDSMAARQTILECCTASLLQIKTSGAPRGKRFLKKEATMRTTRDAIKQGWLPCPEAQEEVDVGLSFADCKNDHGCEDRQPSDCPLYVERVIRRAVTSAAPAGRESD
jgi:hypothetical protein